MNYLELLREATQKTDSIVCVGLDPVLERIPLEGDPEEVITTFFTTMLDAFKEANCLPGAVKPNSAFYEQYGLPGLRALEKVIAKARELNIPVILDAKRGDIGKTSKAYARAAFDIWKADALTVAPYMGSDSVQPFIEHESKGIYLLVRTSNKGARDMQDLLVNGEPLYVTTAKKLLEWAKPGSGAVVGATYPAELATLAKMFAKTNVPLLIPGVGAQGGSASQVVTTLKEANYDLAICRINSSSGITYAHEKDGTPYAQAAVQALQQLNAEIGNLSD